MTKIIISKWWASGKIRINYGGGVKINELWGIGEAAPEYRAAKSKIKTKDRGNWAGESNSGDGGGIEGKVR